MSSHYKAFLVVMILTTLAFWLARPAFNKFMADEDFVRRRNLWLSLTLFAFLIPSFWLYMGVAALLIGRTARRDPNPAALYLFLLLAIPPFSSPIPGFGVVNTIFPLNHFRLLAIVLLLPAAWKVRRVVTEPLNDAARPARHGADALLVIYCGLQVVILAPHASVTESMRNTVLLGMELLLPYYVISRSCDSKTRIVEALAAFALSAVVLAPIAVFEMAKSWLMYSSIADYWHVDSPIKYLMRGDILRAQATSGQSIILGNFYAVVLGLWLYLQTSVTGWRRWLGSAGIAAGLIAPFARGPWVGALVCLFVFFAAGPNAKTRTLRFIGISLLMTTVVLASPAGSWVVDHLPFVGSIDEGSITYRQLVIDRTLALIRLNPLFGSPYFFNYMEDLRTGEGIIDLLNVYLTIGMAYGLVTLLVFVSFFAAAIHGCWRTTRSQVRSDPDGARLGAGLLASLSATLVIIYTVSNYLSVPYIYVSLAALMVAYARLSSVEAESPVSAAQRQSIRPALRP